MPCEPGGGRGGNIEGCGGSGREAKRIIHVPNCAISRGILKVDYTASSTLLFSVVVESKVMEVLWSWRFLGRF